MATKARASRAKVARTGTNPDGVWAAFTRMIEDPRFTAKVASAGDQTLASYNLDSTGVRLLSNAASEGLERLCEGNPGRNGKALATYMGKLRANVSSEARTSLNDAVFRRFIDPLRLHAMHEAF
jgi:hypothetical protein